MCMFAEYMQVSCAHTTLYTSVDHINFGSKDCSNRSLTLLNFLLCMCIVRSPTMYIHRTTCACSEGEGH